MTNKREFPRELPVDMSFVDRQGIAVYPSREDYNARNTKKTAKAGKAYAFFDCNASKEDIEEELPFIRKCVKTPNSLELSLTEDADALTGDTQLLQIAKYVMEATYPNATNNQTADELASILNQAYQSPLYEKGKAFRGIVVYKERGKYLSKE